MSPGPKVFMVVQEGGSSSELYVHLFNTHQDAVDYRVDCADDGAYRTTPVVELPDKLAAALLSDSELEASFLSFMSAFIGAFDDLDLVED